MFRPCCSQLNPTQDCWGRRREVQFVCEVVRRQQFLHRRWPPFCSGFDHNHRSDTSHSGHASHCKPSPAQDCLTSHWSKGSLPTWRSCKWPPTPRLQQRPRSHAAIIRSVPGLLKVWFFHLPSAVNYCKQLHSENFCRLPTASMIPWALQHQS